jgi:hypothetical protein
MNNTIKKLQEMAELQKTLSDEDILCDICDNKFLCPRLLVTPLEEVFAIVNFCSEFRYCKGE